MTRKRTSRLSHVRVHVPGTDRVFTPRVSGVVPDERMTWTGGFSPMFKGVRTFELRPRSDGATLPNRPCSRDPARSKSRGCPDRTGFRP